MTFVRTQRIPSGATHCVAFAICILFMVIKLHFDVATTTSDSVLAGTIMNFTTRIVVCLFGSSKGALRDNKVAILAAVTY